VSYRILFFLILLSSLSNCNETPLPKSPPNVILILVDDMGFSDLGAYGSEVSTPNIDRLAFEGIRFSNAYNTSKCFPSRAVILTGLYSQQTGYHQSFRQPIRNAITLGELFRSEGYTTLWSGKHHSTENPIDRGFDHYSGLLDGAANHFNPGLKRVGEGQPAQKGLKKTPVTYRNWVIEGEIFNPYTPQSKDFYSTDIFTDYSLNWMEQIESKDPFFLYLSYTAPHDPLMAWPKDIEKYKDYYARGYEVIRKKRFEKQKQLGVLSKNALLSLAEFPDWDSMSAVEKVEESRTMAVYAAMIDRLDQNIGRIVDKLEQQGKLNNTLIIFTSDNGGSSEVVEISGGTGKIGTATNWKSLGKNWANVSNTPYREFKNWSHEGGIKTPLIAYWPEKIKNKGFISHKPVHFIDVLPTLQELLGAEYPKSYNGNRIFPSPGKSFLPQILGDSSSKREGPIFWQWRYGKAVRNGNWKLVAHKEVWELYNLETDPIEEVNLIYKEKEKTAELKSLYEDWAAKFKINNR
jgi:arylsulfatase A-like enzyme